MVGVGSPLRTDAKPTGAPQSHLEAGSMTIELAPVDLRAILSEARVRQLDLTRVPLLSKDQSLTSATAAMREARHGSALVCEAGQLIGIVTERDILRAVGGNLPMSTPVCDIMTSRPKTLGLDDSLFDAVQWMDRGGYRRLPVVDGDGCAAGIVDLRTVVNFLVEQMPSIVYNQASRRVLTVRDCEGA